ncbi:TPA: hypothetical protein U1C34_001919 [Streptococcus suis]|nr:hypothetical protein [Streptococcus suis]HEM3623105.1 hypothetical protein [Streptococcus suis]HEM3627542.1 hypothetical protein [Streptococcus suis]HEM3631895.1 hypothetical protein [Streptococcus suis]HEM3640613.1 hypothetical protein [Streptococcus suis]
MDETVYLNSIPNLKEQLVLDMRIPSSKMIPEDLVPWTIPITDCRVLEELTHLENTGTLSTVFERMENELEDDFLVEDSL